MFFAKSGKDKVRMGNGEEVALGLGSLGRALAPDAAGADGNQRLFELIAGALGVVVGIDEAGEASLLKGLEDLAAGPDASHQNARADHENQGLAEIDAAEKEAGNKDGRVGKRGSQVGLNEH